jgi:selenocysteine lyase/cysteine desulfurase
VIAMTDIATRLALTDQRAEFEIDDEFAYFNTAAISPLLRSVRQAADEALDRRAKPWTLSTRDWFGDVDTLRSRLAQLVGAVSTDVALIPATSYGLAVASRNLTAGSGSRVLVLDQEFPSNHYTWQRFAQRTGAELAVVKREPGQTWTDAIVAAIDDRVAVVSTPNVHWSTGALIELPQVAKAARAVGASFIVDASQSLGVVPVDVTTLRPDALVAVGYKWLLGPYSLGYLYLDPSLHGGEPLEENWIMRAGSEDFSALSQYQDEYRPGAQRFDVGERTNFQLTPMAAEALSRVLAWAPERIGAALRLRTDAIAGAAERLGLSVEPSHSRGPHIVGVELPSDSAHRVASSLAEAQVVVSVRGTSIRIAPHLHNNDEDVRRLIAAMASAI